jgi:glycerol-3-phosphate acyltransferase PlsX
MLNDGTQRRSAIRVAVDAMGGDYGPRETVKGAIEAQRDGPYQLILVGDQGEINVELAKYDTTGLSVTVVHSVGKIGDDEHPVRALGHKSQASIVVTTKLLKGGSADVIVSLGSTGASMASAAMILGLMDGLERPCIGGPFLGLIPRTVLVDAGSNIDCRPSLLLSFGALGAVFAHKFLGIENPRVGLLSVGAEEAKGNRQVQESYHLIKESHLNFVGNVEGMDFFTDRADVIVCDGFVGNILMKFTEGLGSALVTFLGKQLLSFMTTEQVDRLTGDLWRTTNLPRTLGGPLFGVNGAVVLGHGSARADGVAGAIDTAVRYFARGLVGSMQEELSEIHRRGKLKV